MVGPRLAKWSSCLW